MNVLNFFLWIMDHTEFHLDYNQNKIVSKKFPSPEKENKFSDISFFIFN